MDTTSILLGIQKNLPYGKMGDAAFIELKNRLDTLSDRERSDVHFSIKSSNAIRSVLSMCVWNIVFGSLGVARFMIGDIMLGFMRLAYQILVITFAVLSEMNPYSEVIYIMSLIFMVGVWIWWFVDLYLVDKKVRMQNLRKVLLAIDSVKNQSK